MKLEEQIKRVIEDIIRLVKKGQKKDGEMS